MWAVARKEIIHLLGNPAGYVTIAIYLIFNGLYLFVFPDTSLFNNQYASLSTYIDLAPWVFIFLIPAVNMRIFSEEMKSGTIERLLTLPLSPFQVVFGKYIACQIVILLCIICSLPFLITVSALAGNSGFDVGATLGGYIALAFLGMAMNAIALYVNITQHHIIIAFLGGCLVCFLFFSAFQMISQIKLFEGSWDYYLQLWGIQSHFDNMKRGVLDLRDVIYFASITVFFITLSIQHIKRSMR